MIRFIQRAARDSDIACKWRSRSARGGVPPRGELERRPGSLGGYSYFGISKTFWMFENVLDVHKMFCTKKTLDVQNMLWTFKRSILLYVSLFVHSFARCQLCKARKDAKKSHLPTSKIPETMMNNCLQKDTTTMIATAPK